MRSVSGHETAARVASALYMGDVDRWACHLADTVPPAPIGAGRFALANQAVLHLSMEPVFGPWHVQIVFEGPESSCYPDLQRLAGGIAAIQSRRLN